MSNPTQIYQRITPGDAASMRASQEAILDMVRAKIEAGSVESLALLMVAKDPQVSGGEAYTGSRFLVSAAHLDLVEDVFHEMMTALVNLYKVTPDQLRAERARKLQGR